MNTLNTENQPVEWVGHVLVHNLSPFITYFQSTDGKEYPLLKIGLMDGETNDMVKPFVKITRCVAASNYVEMDTFQFVTNDKHLITNGLATCSALALIIGKYKFLAHVSPTQNIQKIVDALNAHNTNITSAQIVRGVMTREELVGYGMDPGFPYNEQSYQKCMDILGAVSYDGPIRVTHQSYLFW